MGRLSGREAEGGAEVKPAEPHQLRELTEANILTQLVTHVTGDPLHLPRSKTSAVRRDAELAIRAVATGQLCAKQVDPTVEEQTVACVSGTSSRSAPGTRGRKARRGSRAQVVGQQLALDRDSIGAAVLGRVAIMRSAHRDDPRREIDVRLSEREQLLP